MLRLGGTSLGLRAAWAGICAAAVAVIAVEAPFFVLLPLLLGVRWAAHGYYFVADLERRVLLVPGGLLGWRRRALAPGSFVAVRVTARRNHSTISLVDAEGRVVAGVVAAQSYRRSLAQATRLAAAFGVALDDGQRQRDAGRADEPLRDRLLRTATAPGDITVEHDSPFRDAREALRAPTRPQGVRAEVRVDGETLVARAAVPWGSRVALWLVSAATLAAMLAPFMAPAAAATISEGYLIASALGLTLGVVAVGLLFIVSRRWRLTLDHERLRIRHFAKLRVDLPVTAIADVFVADLRDPRYARMAFLRGRAILVVNLVDGRLFAFGHGSTAADLAWVAARVQHHLVVTA